MSIAKLAIIGVGKIGIRHLQALALINRDIILQVIDPSEDALKFAQNEIKQVDGSGRIKKIEFIKDISGLFPELDLIIIATNSDKRYSIIQEILRTKKVKYLILEKILFQRIEHFSEINELLKQKNIKAWVNCPLRTLTFYKELKSLLHGSNIIDYHVSYSDLGIATNAIHHIDLFAYLIGETEFEFNPRLLDKRIISSKRTGFVEFTGALLGETPKGNRITITSYPIGSTPPLVQISSNKVRCLIREYEKKAFISNENNNWVWEEVDYIHPYQSELTHLFVQQILDTGYSDLIEYDNSCKLHIPLLKAFMQHIQNNSKEDVLLCPIT